MRFRFLLFFILVFFLGAFSVKAQDLVYNGDVKIEIKITQFLQKNMDDHDNGDLECRANFWKDYGAGYRQWNYYTITGNGTNKNTEYVPWYNLKNIGLPSTFHSQTYTLKSQTLVDYFKTHDMPIRLDFWEHDGGSNGNDFKEKAYFSINTFIAHNASPGYHTKRIESDGHHWAVDFEYSITPPAPTIKDIISEIREEESDVSISCQDLGANIKYEWQMNIDKKTTTRSEPTGLTDWTVYNECMKGCDQSGINQREQRVAVEKAIRPIEDGPCDEQCLSIAEIYEDVVYTVWEYPKDKILNTYRTDQPSLTYHIPEFDGFTKNYKFIAYSYLETKDKATLKSLDPATIAIVDVFPSFPVINESVATKKVTCFGGDDGEVTIKVDGDLGKGVDEYRILVIKDSQSIVQGPFNKGLEDGDVLGQPKEILINNLSAGTYDIVVNNLFSNTTVDTVDYFNNHAGLEKRFMIGHDTISFTIEENDLIELENNANFISNNKCNEYIVDASSVKAIGGLGGYKYSLDPNNIATSSRVLATSSELPAYGETKDIPFYVVDKAGCKGQGVAKLTRDAELKFFVTDQEKLPIITCFGETTNFQVSAQGGSGTYQFEMDKPIDSNSTTSTESCDFDVKAGSHEFYVKESHGCASNTTRTFKENDAILLENDYPKLEDIKCYGDDNGRILLKFIGGVGQYTADLYKESTFVIAQETASRSDELVFDELQSGSYYFMVKDEKGCDKRFPETGYYKINQSQKIEVYDLDTDNYSGYTYKCNGLTDEIKFRIKGGNAPYGISNENDVWSGVPREELKGFAVKGETSTFTITDALDCPVDTLINLNEPQGLDLKVNLNEFKSADETEVYNIKEHGGVGNIGLTIKGGISPYQVQLLKDGKTIETGSSSNGNLTFTNKIAGDYLVRIEGAFGDCAIEDIVTLTEPDPLVALVKLPVKLNTFDIKCHGDDATVQVIPSGGIKSYVIEIRGDMTLSKTVNGSVETDFNLKAGSYTLSIKDEHNLPKVITKFTLTEPKPLDLNVESMSNFEGGYQIKCFEEKGEVKVTPSGGVSKYKLIQDNEGTISKWDDIDTPQTISNLDSGAYLYRITDANGCEERASIELKKPAHLVLQEPVFVIPSCHKDDMGDDSLKKDGEIKIGALGGCDVQNYTFSIYDEENSEKKLLGKTVDFTGLKKGTYNIKVTDANGCFDEKHDQNLKEPDLLFLDKVESIAPICFKESNGSWASNIAGGTGELFDYSIDGATELETGRVFNQSGKKSGSYEVTISDEKKCLYRQDIVVPEKDSIVNSMDIAGIDVLKGGKEIKFKCFGDDMLTSFFVEGGNPAYSVTIKKDAAPFHAFTNVANNTKITFPEDKKLGSGNYTFLTVDQKGCRSEEVEFKLDEPVQFAFAKSAPKYENHLKQEFDYSCLGASELLDVQIKGGTSPYEVTYDTETKEVAQSEDYIDFIVSGKKPEFIIKDANGCPTSYSPILEEPEELHLDLRRNEYSSNKDETFNIKCYDGRDTIWAKATGGISPYTFNLSGNGMDISQKSDDKTFFVGLPAGDYSVKVTGAYNNDCFVISEMSLKQPEPITSVVDLSDHYGFEIKCNGLTDTIKVNALGGISPYTIHLEGMGLEQEYTDVSDEQKTFKDLPAGNYQLSIMDSFLACEYNKSIELREPTALSFDIKTSHYEGDFEIRCSYLKDTVTITPFGGLPVTNTSSYEIEQTDEEGNRQLGNIVAGENLAFKNLGAGTYTYKIKDDNECTFNDKVELRKPDTLKIATVDFKIPTCHERDMGDVSKRTDGEIQVKAIGGVCFADGYDYLLNKMPLSEAKGRLDSIRGISEAVFNHLETGEYVVEVRDANGCMIKKDDQKLKQPDWLHIENFNSVIPECYEAQDGFWESEVIGGTSSTGTYSFILSKNDEVYREGETGRVWNQDQLGKGNYLIEISDDLGCYYKQVEEMLQPDEMAIDFDVMGVTGFGNNDGAVQVRVRGGNGAYRYQWYYKGEKYPDGDLKKIEKLYAGEYTVEVWDKNNCPYGNNEFGIANGLKKTASVIEPGSELSIVASPVKASYYGAEDGTIQVSAVGGWPYGQWPGYEFSLDHADWRVTSQFENLKAGLYQLRVKDSKGVMDSTIVEIKEPEEIIIKLDKSNCLCNNDSSGSIRVNATGGTPPFTYAINYALDFNNSNEFHGLNSGTYRVFVKDKFGNIKDEYTNIEEPERLKVELLGLENSTCNSSNGSAQITIIGGTPDYYVDWSGLYPTNKLYPDNLAASDYSVKVIDANLCSDSLSFKIEEKRGPEIRLKELKEVRCHDSKDGEISIEINNGTAPYDIVWKDTETTNSTDVKQLSKGKYGVVVSDANNCFDEAEYVVTGPNELELYVSSSQSPNCVGINDGSIQTAAVGGSPEYIYRLNDKSNTSGWFPNLGAENFQIEVEDSNGCKNVVNTELIEPTELTIDLPQQYVLCQNQKQIINAGVIGSTSEWFYNGGYFSSENEVELSEEGVYKLKLMSEKGCEAQHDFSITYLDYEVVADFIIPVEAIVGDTIVAVDISWELPDSVKWNFPETFELVKKDEASIWLRVVEAGEHTVGISIFKNDCSDYMEKQIRVESTSNKRKAGFIQPNKGYITDAKLFPNPNKGDFHLKLILNKAADVDIEIYDVQRGGKIDTRKGENNAAYQFDFNNRSVFRANNMYAIVISVGDEKRVLKFFVY